MHKVPTTWQRRWSNAWMLLAFLVTAVFAVAILLDGFGALNFVLDDESAYEHAQRAAAVENAQDAASLYRYQAERLRQMNRIMGKN